MKILIAILARDKSATLPLYLKCIEEQQYDKRCIILYIRTNNNSDNTREILLDFVTRNKDKYADIIFDDQDVPESLTKHHDWNKTRFRVLGAIRQKSVKQAILSKAHYFVADCDNFLLPHTLRDLSLKLQAAPIIAPLLGCEKNSLYSNYHFAVDPDGYYKDSPMYYPVRSGQVKGLIEAPVVHCTYLIRNDVLPYLSYDDDTGRHEYVIFSHSARKHNIKQCLDNSQEYGFITFATKEEEVARFTWENLRETTHKIDLFQDV